MMLKNIVESFNLKPMRRLEKLVVAIVMLENLVVAIVMLEKLVVAIVMLENLVETREKFGKIGLDKCNV